MGNNNANSTQSSSVQKPKPKKQSNNQGLSKQFDLQIFSKEDLCIIDNLGEFCQGDELNITGKDLSKCVQNAFKLFPFNTVGRVISIFPSLEIDTQQDFPFGTGTIIGQRVVITSAHNLYQKNSKLRAKHIFFQSECEGGTNGQLIKVKRYAIHKSFFDSQNKQSQSYDMAILLLQDNSIIKSQMIMPLKFDYNFTKFKDAQVLISGYPKQKNQGGKFVQFYESSTAIHQKQNFLLYKHYTSSGHSGSPVLMKQIDINGDESYCQVGVHKGSTGAYNFCVLFNEKESSFVQMLKKVSVEQYNNASQIKESNVQLSKILNQLQSKQKKSPQSTKWFTQLNNIRWSRFNPGNNQLHCYLAGNTPKIMTFSRGLQYIVDAIEAQGQQKCLVNVDTWEYMTDRVKGLQLSVQEQVEYLQILREFVEVNFGVQQVEYESTYCGVIGERLFNFWNTVYYKVIASDDDFQDKQQKQTNPQSQQQIDSLLKLITHGYTKTVSSSARIQSRYQNQLRFFLSNKNIHRALIISNKKQINQPQSANVFWLKGEVMREAGYLKRALIYYQKCLQVEEKQFGSNSTNYATTLNNIGLIYKNEGDYELALEFYQKSYQIQQRLNGTATINTIPTMNNIALIYSEKGDTHSALTMMLGCLQIEKQHHGANHIDTATTLHNIGLLYDDRKQYSKALEFYQSSLVIKEAHHGKDSVSSCSTLNNIGMVYWNMKEFDKSLVYFMKCLQIEERVHGTDCVNSLITLNNIASVFREFKVYKGALQYYKRALAIKEKIKGKNSIEYLKTLKLIASIYYQDGKYTEAIEHLNKCLEIQIALKGSDLGTAEIYEKLAEIGLKSGQVKVANENATLCYELRYKLLGKNNQLTKKTYKLLKKTK